MAMRRAKQKSRFASRCCLTVSLSVALGCVEGGMTKICVVARVWCAVFQHDQLWRVVYDSYNPQSGGHDIRVWACEIAVGWAPDPNAL